MKDTIQYDGFIGSVHFSSKDDCLFGKIEGINDLISFEGQDVKELKETFRKSVEDYKELCKHTGKQLHKSYKGSFNVRIPSGLHKKAVQKAVLSGISLNKYVQNAIERDLKSR